MQHARDGSEAYGAREVTAGGEGRGKLGRGEKFRQGDWALCPGGRVDLKERRALSSCSPAVISRSPAAHLLSYRSHMATMVKQGNWTEFWSKRKNRPFFVNAVTGEKRWSIPDDEGDHQLAADPSMDTSAENEDMQEARKTSSENPHVEQENRKGAGTADVVAEAGRRLDSAFSMDGDLAPAEDEVLEELGILAKSHDELEKKVIKKLENVVKQKEAEENQRQAERQNQVIEMLEANIKRLEEKLANPAYSSEFQQSVLKEQLEEVREKLRKETLSADKAGHVVSDMKQDSAQTMFVKAIESTETERDRMIRTGKLTPFAGKEGAERVKLLHSKVHEDKSKTEMTRSVHVAGAGGQTARSRGGERESRKKEEAKGSGRVAKKEGKEKKKRKIAIRSISSSHGRPTAVDDGSIEAFHNRISNLRQSSR
eukprot:752331-Hanusia_phi.AAC.5